MKQGKPQERGPIVVVQWLEVEWDKSARGAEAATIRNQLPKALPLSEVELEADIKLVLHYLRNGYSSGKTGAISQHRNLTLDHLSEIEIKLFENQIQVVPHPRKTGMGRCRRTISTGQWSRFVWNERIVYEGTWAYKQITVNIAYLPEFTPTIFLDQEPSEIWSELVRLY